MLLELAGEDAERAGGPGGHGAAANPEGLGDRGFRQVEEELQGEHLTLVHRQPGNGGEQLAEVLAVDGGRFRGPDRGSSGTRCNRALTRRRRAVHRAGPVDDGGAQIGEEAGRVADLVPVPVQAEERVLDDVLSGLLIASEHESKPD